jgi:hypothetical protein
MCQHQASLITGVRSQRQAARLKSDNDRKANRWEVVRGIRTLAGLRVTAGWYCTDQPLMASSVIDRALQAFSCSFRLQTIWILASAAR